MVQGTDIVRWKSSFNFCWRLELIHSAFYTGVEAGQIVPLSVEREVILPWTSRYVQNWSGVMQPATVHPSNECFSRDLNDNCAEQVASGPQTSYVDMHRSWEEACSRTHGGPALVAEALCPRLDTKVANRGV